MKKETTALIQMMLTYGITAVIASCLRLFIQEVLKNSDSSHLQGEVPEVTRSFRRFHLNHITLVLFLILFATGIALAEDPRTIMQNVLDRDDGTTEISRIKLSTAKFVKSGNKLVNAENPRVKLMDTVRKDYGPREKDHKSISIIIEPSSENGIGFLQFDYEQKEKETDQWIYLSAMGKVKRIVSGNDHEPKTGSFFGSEISYEDLEQKFIDDYTYTLLGNKTYRNRKCWMVESVPTKEHAKKSNYSKSVDYVDQETYIVLKSILYNRSGKKVKQVYQGKIETIENIHVPRQMIVINLESGRRTVMTIEDIIINQDVDDAFLTKRTLTDGAFREKNLKKYQAHF